MEDFVAAIIVLFCLQIAHTTITMINMVKIEELNLKLRLMALTREGEDKWQK